MTCPGCGAELDGLATYCFSCEEYTEELTDLIDKKDGASKRPAQPVQHWSEADLRMAVRKALTSMGWEVLDFEQGYRPNNCKNCGGQIPGGTRVPLGVGDLFVMGHGVGAWVELKRWDGAQTKSQIDFQARCSTAGFPYAVVRTVQEALDFMALVRASG